MTSKVVKPKCRGTSPCCRRPIHGGRSEVGWLLGTESVETVRNLDALGDKLITVLEYQMSKPEPSIEKLEKELEKLSRDIEDGAKLTAK